MKINKGTANQPRMIALQERYDRMAHKAKKSVPTDRDILDIPQASCGEYELSDAEVRRLRSRIYSISRDNAAGWRFRTMRDGPYLLIWKL